MSELELGQMLFSNNDWHQYDADWATDGLHLLAQVITESRGNDPEGFRSTLTTNSGEEEFVNEIFEMRSYCWCDAGWDEDSSHPHAKGCPPNFFYKPKNIMITWYKHAGRGITANIKYPGAREWFQILKNCEESINGSN